MLQILDSGMSTTTEWKNLSSYLAQISLPDAKAGGEDEVNFETMIKLKMETAVFRYANEEVS